MARENNTDSTQQNENPEGTQGQAGQSNPGGDGTTQPAGGQGNDGEATDYKTKYEQAIAHSREWERRAKANKEASDELQQLKDAQKTEAQKQADRLAELEAENAEYKSREERATWRNEISNETGVPANILRGNTREEIEAHAKELQAVLPDPEKGQGGGDDPAAAQRASSDKSTANAFSQSPGDSPKTIQQKLAAAEKAGDWDTAANLKASMLGTQN